MVYDGLGEIGMGHMVLRRAAMTPDAVALTFENDTLTFRQFANNIRALAQLFVAMGLSQGDRIGYIGMNHPRFLEALYASAILGAIFVPVNYRLTAQEIVFIANDADVSILLADESSAEILAPYKDLVVCEHFVSIGSFSPEWESLALLLALHAPADTQHGFQGVSVSANDVALIMYTSGTTGRPKGAQLTHGNIFWNLLNARFMEETMRCATLTCAPLFHIGGLNVTTHPSLVSGVQVVLHAEFNAQKILRDIERYEVSTMFGAPTMFDMIMREPHYDKADFSSVLAFNCGAAPVPMPLIEAYSAKGVRFCQGYGLTETAPYISVLSTLDSQRKKGSAGKPLMFAAVKIVGIDGEPLPAEEKGEIVVSGPNVTPGYWRLDEATKEAFDAEGWFRTGDIGYLDEEGYLYICDRKKDMIITGGENVYPAEVEGVLLTHPAISEVAVIGLPDDKWGERVTAVIALSHNAALSIEDLDIFLSDRLARFKQPRTLRFVDALPRNPAGKVQKFALREMLLAPLD